MVGAVSPRQYSAGVLSQELCDGIPLLLLECISCRLRRSSSAIPATQYNPVSPVPDGCSVTNAHLCIIQPASRQPASQPARGSQAVLRWWHMHGTQHAQHTHNPTVGYGPADSLTRCHKHAGHCVFLTSTSAPALKGRQHQGPLQLQLP